YSRRCRARVEVSVCCALIPCRLHCGALFHLCKEEDHLLLCPNVRVPCLNAEYGCPRHLPRSSQAAHLQVCPASVVCCSMEWLRWPTDDTNPCSNVALQETVLQEMKGQGEPLDLATALVDQSDLYDRLKMKPLFPELIEADEEEIEDEKKEETAMGGGSVNVVTDEGKTYIMSNLKHTKNDKCVLSHLFSSHICSLGQVSGISKGKYDLCEMMFSMEKGGCAVAQANQDNPKPGEEVELVDEDKTGQAPWQEGVLERLGQDLTPQEYNMYVVHHGSMLLTFGKINACTPREDDFVYGSLEPIPVQTLHSFKIPDGYHYSSRRAHHYDTSRPPSEPRSVDTSDLVFKDEDCFSDEAASTLLGYAEMEVRGHKISESNAYDGLYVDVATQTHFFRAAPFKAKTTLAEVMVDRPLKLHLQLQSDRVNSRNTRANCVFTFLCGHTFHRGEFPSHFRNVHSDIQTSLSGWFEQRCPLSYLGCTYSQRRFQPSTHKATVSYDRQLRSFNLRPTLVASVGRGGGGEDSLSSLPYEVLCHMARFLDSLSLSQLALVSQLMRQVSSSLLQERGMVTLRWEKKTYSHGGAKWRVWEFSHLFSSVDSWHMADIPPISAHLKVCPYYETSLHSEPVPLSGMSDTQEGSQERLSLVDHFARNRLIHSRGRGNVGPLQQ
uniref:F-box protein 40 n=1 Tax=Cyclopterus lumpus TaxID=8103 RepID=A0A8C2ZKM8_CYCLU